LYDHLKMFASQNIRISKVQQKHQITIIQISFINKMFVCIILDLEHSSHEWN